MPTQNSAFAVLSALAFLLTGGCGESQRGRFIIVGERSMALSSPIGVVDIVDGRDERDEGGSPRSQALLFFVIFCPNMRPLGSEGRSDYGRYVSSFNFTWKTETGPVSTSISWDRRRDTVSIAGRSFQRQLGNVFVIRRETDGGFVPQQLSTLGERADFLGVLQHVKSELPHDPVVAGLALNSHLDP